MGSEAGRRYTPTNWHSPLGMVTELKASSNNTHFHNLCGVEQNEDGYIVGVVVILYEAVSLVQGRLQGLSPSKHYIIVHKHYPCIRHKVTNMLSYAYPQLYFLLASVFTLISTNFCQY